MPAWLRSYYHLSTGQKFRADLAKIIAEAPERVVIDEFTSVVDRQIAQIGSAAFAKAWRRTNGQAVLLSCHYDILDWLEPDWVFDTATKRFLPRGSLQHKRPRIDLEIRLGGWELWPFFKPHHYLDSPPMIAGKCYVAFVNGEPVAHLGVSTKNVPVKRKGKLVQAIEARACRLVVLPEWQGAGVGTRFLNHVAQLQLDGEGVIPGKRMTTLFHTSHPQLCQVLRYSKKWRQVSGTLNGGKNGAPNMTKSKKRSGNNAGLLSGYGGHFRAVQGFRYYGETT